MSLFWNSSALAFVLLDLVLGGAAAWMAGRTLARDWRGGWHVAGYMLLLGGAVRFCHFALAGGELISPYYFFVDALIMNAIALLSFRVMRAGQMTRQYPWLYRRTSPITWALQND